MILIQLRVFVRGNKNDTDPTSDAPYEIDLDRRFPHQSLTLEIFRSKCLPETFQNVRRRPPKKISDE
jgi:hypothetical protein